MPTLIKCLCPSAPRPLLLLPELSPGVRVCCWCKTAFREGSEQPEGQPFDFRTGADLLCNREEVPEVLNL